MKKYLDGMMGPVLVLFVICLLTTFALALTNEITAPIIEAQRRSAVEVVEFAGMPDPESFIAFVDERLPAQVSEAFMMPDKSYFVIMTRTRGFSGRVTFFVGMDSDGSFTGIMMGENSETPGIGSRVAAGSYLEQYFGQSDPRAVDAVSGATVTTRALWAALETSNEAFELMRSQPHDLSSEP